jgi:hypothetical protein
MLHKYYILGGCVFSGLFCGCAANPPTSNLNVLPNTFHPQIITLDESPVILLEKSGTTPWVRVFIEGDGSAFTPTGQPSGNPTPRTPIALQLMQADTSGATLYYLGRPCQWVALPQAGCTSARWTTQRFTPELLAAYTQQVQQLSNGRPTELIGFSGGAWFAVNIAAQLPNVVGVRAVAGNLNPNLINAHHRVPAMVVGEGEAGTPKPLLYYSGGRDRVIPPKLVAEMVEGRPCSRVLSFPKTTHTKGWEEAWQAQGEAALPNCALTHQNP